MSLKTLTTEDLKKIISLKKDGSSNTLIKNIFSGIPLSQLCDLFNFWNAFNPDDMVEVNPKYNTTYGTISELGPNKIRTILHEYGSKIKTKDELCEEHNLAPSVLINMKNCWNLLFPDEYIEKVNKVSPDVLEFIQDGINNGESYQSIAETLKISRQRVGQYVIKYKMNVPRKV